MGCISRTIAAPVAPFSPLLLSDRLLTVAQHADRAGYCIAVEDLPYVANEWRDAPNDEGCDAQCQRGARNWIARGCRRRSDRLREIAAPLLAPQ